MELYDGASYRINIEGMDSTLIVDSFRGIIKANIVDADDYIIVDYENKTFYGNFVGNVVDDLGNDVLNISEKAFYGNVIGNIVNESGHIIVDNLDQIFYGNVLGNIVDDIGNLVVDKNEKLFHGNVVGNVVNELGNIIVDKNQRIFFGNIVDENGTMVLDSENKIFIGNFSGNIVDHTGNIVYNSINNSLWLDDLEVSNFIRGNVKGDVYNANGNLAYDSLSNSAELNELTVKKINAGDIEVTDSVVGEFVGTFAGNVYSQLGEIILDTDIQTIKANLLSERMGIAYDYMTNTFYGNFVGNMLNQTSSFGILNVGDKENATNGSVSIFSNSILEDDYGPLSIYVSKNSTSPGVINLIKTRGTTKNTQPVQPGDSIGGLLFGAQIGDRVSDLSPIALLEAIIPNDAVFNNNTLPGQLNLRLMNRQGEIHNALTISPEGYLTTKIKDLTVVGETGNSPLNSNTPTKWLEMSVNGETVFMPLYQ
jgi:hypothetical protein